MIYSKNPINDFTIVIPTFNRPDYLKRILEFYQNYNVNIKIFDSSINRFDSDMLLKSNTEYIHVPNMEPLDKAIYALEYVFSKYMVFCADDDFIFINAIKKCSDFLNNNNDYVCVQGELISFKYFKEDSNIEYKIETYFPIIKHSSFSESITDRFFSFSAPYRHSFYGVHRVNNILYIYKLIKKYKLTEPFLLELVQAILLTLSGKILTFNDCIYHLREMMKITSSRKYQDIPSLVNMNHPEISIVKSIIVEQLEQKHNILHEISVEMSETFFKDFCDFVQEKKSKSQKFHQIILNKNTTDKYNRLLLDNLYQQEPDLKLAENIILKHKVSSGFLYQENTELINLSKSLLKTNQIIENLKKDILTSDRIVIYGAGTFASLLIEIFNLQIKFIVDKNKDLVGKKLKNKHIKDINALSSEFIDYDIIIISVLGRNNEILNSINQLNLEKVILFC